jgi:GH24 family phage-related lysozyme (muramidase)
MIRLKYLLSEATLASDTDFREKVKSWEGPGPVDANNNHLAYDDANPSVPAKPGAPVQGTLTIGYGTTAVVLPNLKPGMKISPQKAEQLLTKGIAEHEAKARRLVSKYDTYPAYVREAILNAIYRGDLGPKTIAAINKGQWDDVSVMYLQHPNYTNPGKFPGVVKRMKSNADAFNRYAKELNPSEAKPAQTSWVGKTLYPLPGDPGYANVRDEDYVNNGFINNVVSRVWFPKPIGVIQKAQTGQDGKKWYYVKLADGSGYGYVRSDVVKLGGSKFHVVKPGETLLQIALRNGLTLDRIKDINLLTNDNIRPGQQIWLVPKPTK